MTSANIVLKRSRIACRWVISEEILQVYRTNYDEPYRTFTFKYVSTHQNLKNRLLLYFDDDNNNPNFQGLATGKAMIGFELFEMEEAEFFADLKFSVEGSPFSAKRETIFREDLRKVEIVEMCAVDDIFNHQNKYINNGNMVIVVEGYIYQKREVPPCLAITEKDAPLWFDENAKTSEIHIDGQVIFLHFEVLQRMFKNLKKQKTIREQGDRVVFPQGYSKRVAELIVKYHYYCPLVAFEKLSDLFIIHKFIVDYGKMENLAALEEIICCYLNESTAVIVLNYSRQFLAKPAVVDGHDMLNLYKKAMATIRMAVRTHKPVADFNKIPEVSVHAMALSMILKDFR